MILKDIEIIDIIQDGRGVGRTETKTVFVENAVYGEICDVQVINEKNNFFEAKKINTITKSDKEVTPPCPYFYECGGCSIMNINYQTQLELKQNLIKNAVKKGAGLEIKEVEIIPSPELAYRNKIRLQVGIDGSLNYLKSYSDELVEIEECLIANYMISDHLLEIRGITRDINAKFKGLIKEISIRASSKAILLNLAGEFSNEAISYIKEKYSLSKFNINLVGRENIIISGEGYLDYQIFDKTFKITANDFYQVNDYQIENLYGVAKDFLGKNQKVLDLYCGSATSSIAINNDNIVGVEINKNAIKDASYNAARNGLKDYKFLAKNAKYIDDKFITQKQIDAITVDPPRAGLDKDVVKAIANSGVKKLVYISCNPQTLARDIKRFMDRGYELKKIKAVDMFPQTMHMETVVLLDKN